MNSINNLTKAIGNQKVQYIVVVVLLYLFALYEYKVFIFNLYSYMGFEYNPSVTKICLSLVIFFFSFFFLLIKSSPFIKGISSLVQTLTLLPILVIFQFQELNPSYIICSFLWLVLINSSVFQIKIPKVITLKQNQKSLLLFIITICCLIPFFFIYPIHFNFDLFKLGEETYEVRAELNTTGNLFTSYVISPLSTILLPICAIYGLKENRFGMVIFAVLGTMILFLMTPHKSIFFGIFVVIFFYFKRNIFSKTLLFAGLLLIILFIGKLIYLINGELTIESLFYRRYLLLPALLNQMYFDFFEGNSIYFSNSFLTGFIDYPYKLDPAHLIGIELYNNPETHANNGFLSDGFMNLGYYGMILFTLIVSVIIKFFDALKIDPRYFGLFFLMMNLFRSAALSTSLLTHGLWVLIIICFFIITDQSDKVNIKVSDCKTE